MLDSRLRRLIDPTLDRIGAALGRRGIGADAVTLAGFAAGIASFPALATQAYAAALVLILLNRLMDGLDGAVARHAGPLISAATWISSAISCSIRAWCSSSRRAGRNRRCPPRS